MNILAVVLIILAILLSYIIYLQRRQIKLICRQLAFINNNNTNKMVTQEINSKYISELVDSINGMITNQKTHDINVMRNSNNLKETITNLSHDIRTPLTSLDGYFQLLKESTSDKEKDKYSDIIQNRIDSLKVMLDELFTYTKLQDDNYTLDLEKINFNKLLTATLFSFYDEFNAKGIEPHIFICDEQLSVFCNQAAVIRVIQNIIKNSIEHSLSEMKITLGKSNGKVELVCSNNVDDEDDIDITQVFDRFYKSDVSRTQSSTGLGLSIAKGLTEKMGGTISANLKDEIFSITVIFDIVK